MQLATTKTTTTCKQQQNTRMYKCTRIQSRTCGEHSSSRTGRHWRGSSLAWTKIEPGLNPLCFYVKLILSLQHKTNATRWNFNTKNKLQLSTYMKSNKFKTCISTRRSQKYENRFIQRCRCASVSIPKTNQIALSLEKLRWTTDHLFDVNVTGDYMNYDYDAVTMSREHAGTLFCRCFLHSHCKEPFPAEFQSHSESRVTPNILGLLCPRVNTEDRVGLYVHVNRSDLASFVLLHPQLPVFGWIHLLQQLVYRFHHLRTNKNLKLAALISALILFFNSCCLNLSNLWWFWLQVSIKLTNKGSNSRWENH